MSDLRAPRREHVGRVLELMVGWARLLDSRRTFPFGDLHLTRSQMEALFLIAHADGPATPGLLAASLQVTPGAVTQLMVGLTDAGLVVDERDPHDARRRVLALSAVSRERVEAFEQDVIGQLMPRFDGLDDDELRTLSTLLARTEGPL